jgi:hypothetical protein
VRDPVLARGVVEREQIRVEKHDARAESAMSDRIANVAVQLGVDAAPARREAAFTKDALLSNSPVRGCALASWRFATCGGQCEKSAALLAREPVVPRHDALHELVE